MRLSLMFQSSVFKGLCLGLSLLLGLVLRLSSQRDFLRAGEIHFFGPDEFYHLRRLSYFLQNFPDPLWFDPLIVWPQGAEVPWSEAMMWLVGLPLIVFGVETPYGLEMGATLQMVFWGLVTVVLVFFIARVFFNFYESLFASLLAATSLGIIKYSAFGALDHHIFEILFPGVLLGLLLAKDTAWRSLAVAVVVFLGLWISVANFLVLFALAAAFIYKIHQNELRLSSFMGFVSVCFLMLFLYSLWRSQFSEQAFIFSRLSFAHSFAFLGLFSLVGCKLFCRSWRAYALVSAAGIAAFFVAIFTIPLPLFRTLRQSVEYVGGGRGSLALIQEAQPVWSHYGDWDLIFLPSQFGFLFPLLLLLPLLLLSKPQKKSDWMLLALFFFALLPCLLQKRFSHFLLIPYILILVMILKVLMARYSVLVQKWAWSAALLLAVAPAFVFSPSPPLETRHRLELELLDRLRVEMPRSSKEEVWSRLADPLLAGEAIWAEPNMGSFLLYRTGRPVLINNFFFQRAFRRDWEYRRELSPEVLLSQLRKDGFGWMILQDDWLYFRGLHELLGEDFSRFQVGHDPLNLVLRGEEMDQLAWVQLLKYAPSLSGLRRLDELQLSLPYPYQSIVLFRL